MVKKNTLILILIKEKTLPIDLKKIFKLMNNIVYGKAMENLRKIVKYRLLAVLKTIKKYVSRPSFLSQKIFSRNFAATHEVQPMFTI